MCWFLGEHKWPQNCQYVGVGCVRQKGDRLRLLNRLINMLANRLETFIGIAQINIDGQGKLQLCSKFGPQ